MAVNSKLNRKTANGWETIHPETHADQVIGLDTALAGVSIDSLNDITDVNAPSPGNGEALIWNSTSSKWEPGTVSAASGDIEGVTAGTGLSGGGTSGTVTLNVDLSELTDMTDDVNGLADELILLDSGADKRKLISEIKLSQFNNDLGWTGNVGDITGVTAGTGLTGGGASGTVTLNVDTSVIATQTYVNTAVANLVDSSPTTLDTLNELAAALGDDPNFATTVSNNIGTKVSKSGDTMTGGLLIATGATESGIRFRNSTGDFVGRYSNYVSLFNQLNGSVEIKLPDSGNATIGGNTIFHDGYHPNADKWTTARTLSLTGDVTGSVSWDGSGNASMTTAVVNDSHEHTRLSENSAITYGASYLQWTDTSGNGGTGLNGAAPGNPTNEWWHHLIMNHGNSAGYYVDIAAAFHSDQIYFRRNVAGNLASWRELIHSGNIGSQNVDKVDGYHIVVGSTGTDANTLYFTT